MIMIISSELTNESVIWYSLFAMNKQIRTFA